MAWGIIAGAVLGIAGAALSNGSNRRAANRAENLARQKRALQIQGRDSNLKEAKSNLEQGLANNMLIQSLSGIELSSSTFGAVNNQAYKDYEKDKENIYLQDKFNELGINSEINSINSTRQSGIQQALGYLTAGLNGASVGASFQNSFGGGNIRQNSTTPAQRRQAATWISGLNV